MDSRRLDRIHIRDLRLRCIIGINPDERTKKQDVDINITLYADLRRAAEADSMADTVDYSAIKSRVVAEVEGSSFFLLERLAVRVAEICLSEPQVVAARVLIEKPGALRFARTVGVELIRNREEDA